MRNWISLKFTTKEVNNINGKSPLINKHYKLFLPSYIRTDMIVKIKSFDKTLPYTGLATTFRNYTKNSPTAEVQL